MMMRIRIQILLTVVREINKILFKIFNYFLQNLTKLVMCNFPSNKCKIDDEGEGVRGEEEGMREKE